MQFDRYGYPLSPYPPLYTRHTVGSIEAARSIRLWMRKNPHYGRLTATRGLFLGLPDVHRTPAIDHCVPAAARLRNGL